MLSKKTTLVLGAGASVDFGFPLGMDLKGTISQSLDIQMDDWRSQIRGGSADINNALTTRAQSGDDPQRLLNLYRRSAREVSEAVMMCSSIDDCIERHAGSHPFELCAKLAIAEAILKAENNSPLVTNAMPNQKPDFSPYSRHWLTQFLQIITSGVHVQDLENAFKSLSVIIFNYDRCFEYFVYHWIMKAYRVDPQKSQEIVTQIDIIHPYGSLGSIFSASSQSHVPFGGELSSGRLLDIAQNLKTYSESAVSTGTISGHLADSKFMIFLGFAFHSQNIGLLRCVPPNDHFSRHILATTIGISPAKWEGIRSVLSQMLGTPEQMLWTNTDARSCENLLTEYPIT